MMFNLNKRLTLANHCAETVLIAGPAKVRAHRFAVAEYPSGQSQEPVLLFQYGCTACYAGLTTAFCMHLPFGSSPKRLEYLELSERSLPDRRVSKSTAPAGTYLVADSLE